MTRSLQTRKKTEETGKVLPLVLSLAGAAVNGVIGVPLLFNLRAAVMTTVDRSSVKVWSINLIDNVTAIVLCILWLVFVFTAQHFYEKDFFFFFIPKRFVIFTGGQAVLLAAVFCYSRFALGI
jgi:hypothetical protein